MITTQREPRTVALSGGLLAGAGLLWLVPSNFFFGTDFGFVGGTPFLPQLLAGGVTFYIVQAAILAAMAVIAIGLPLDHPRPRQRATQILLIIFGGWGLFSSILTSVLPLHVPFFGQIFGTTLEIAHIVVGIAAGWLVITQRIIDGWERWLVLVLAISRALMTPLMLLWVLLPTWMLSGGFVTIFFDLVPFAHVVVGGLLLASGLISKNRLAAQLHAEGPDGTAPSDHS